MSTYEARANPFHMSTMMFTIAPPCSAIHWLYTERCVGEGRGGGGGGGEGGGRGGGVTKGIGSMHKGRQGLYRSQEVSGDKVVESPVAFSQLVSRGTAHGSDGWMVAYIRACAVCVK